MTPLGLHHIMGWDHHYGPGPWVANKPRPDWTAVYYHKADAQGIGFDRTTTGSGALDDYSPTVQKLYSDPSKCPDKFLLWFHHLPWDYKLSTGNTLWDELCNHYQSGTESVAAFQKGWNSLKSNIDNERFDHVSTLLTIQYKEAKWWHDACLLYFQQFSRMPFPSGVTKPEHTLKFYEGLEFPYAPGIKPKW
jgi:alpha-glucuronidase